MISQIFGDFLLNQRFYLKVLERKNFAYSRKKLVFKAKKKSYSSLFVIREIFQNETKIGMI